YLFHHNFYTVVILGVYFPPCPVVERAGSFSTLCPPRARDEGGSGEHGVMSLTPISWRSPQIHVSLAVKETEGANFCRSSLFNLLVSCPTAAEQVTKAPLEQQQRMLAVPSLLLCLCKTRGQG
uniref:Uncharacterized protein n=1 Tax=Otus sunia TaxID=257818 RepID=A0A8C8AVX5_9STRI